MKPLVAAALLLLAAGCQSSPPTAPVAQRSNPVADARQAFERGDCGAALPLLRAALSVEPDNIRLHYAAAVCATRLNLADEAVPEFQWVVANAPEASEEFKIAKAWLIETGVLEAAAATTPDSAADGRASSRLRGRVAWSGATARAADIVRVQLHLMGLPDSPTAARHEVIRANDRGEFQFPPVPPGAYKLTNRVAGEPLWRLRVLLEPGSERHLDLTPANSVSVRDDFPEPAR